MPKVKRTEKVTTGAHLSGHQKSTFWMPMAAWLIAMPGLSWAQSDPTPAAEHDKASPSVQQVIDAARRKKAAEVDAAARRLLGTEPAARATPPAPVEADTPQRSTATPSSEELPQIWSLSGIDQRLRAEIFYGGQIYQVDSRQPTKGVIGPWQVQSIQADRVTLAPRSHAIGPHRSSEVLTLTPPMRGTPVSNYPFPTEDRASQGLSLLPPSALRAAQLPLEGVAARAQGSATP